MIWVHLPPLYNTTHVQISDLAINAVWSWWCSDIVGTVPHYNVIFKAMGWAAVTAPVDSSYIITGGFAPSSAERWLGSHSGACHSLPGPLLLLPCWSPSIHHQTSAAHIEGCCPPAFNLPNFSHTAQISVRYTSTEHALCVCGRVLLTPSGALYNIVQWIKRRHI